MTNYTSLNTLPNSGNTVFNKSVTKDAIIEPRYQPEDYNHVMFLVNDLNYGDVFLAWDDDDPGVHTIYFGKRGYEFNK